MPQLASKPSIILADEPVQGLDPSHEIQVMEVLRQLAGEGRGMMVVLHNLSLAARFCDRLFLIHHGKILTSGTPREVLTPESLRQSYGIEATYGEEDGDFYVIPKKRCVRS